MDSKLDKGSVATVEQGGVTHSGVRRCMEAGWERSYLPEVLRGTKRNRAQERKTNGRCDGLTCPSP